MHTWVCVHGARSSPAAPRGASAGEDPPATPPAPHCRPQQHFHHLRLFCVSVCPVCELCVPPLLYIQRPNQSGLYHMLADGGKCLHLPEPIVATRDYQGSVPVKMHLTGRSGEKKAYFSTTDKLHLTRAALPLVNAHRKRVHLLRTDAPSLALNSTDS